MNDQQQPETPETFQPAAILFTETAYKGERLVCLADAAALPEGAGASLRLRTGSAAVLYEGAGFEGRSQLVAADIPDLLLEGGAGVAWDEPSLPRSIRLLEAASRPHSGRWALRAGGRYLAMSPDGVEAVDSVAMAGLFSIAEETEDGGRVLIVSSGDQILRARLEGDVSWGFRLTDLDTGHSYELVDGRLTPTASETAALLTAPLMIAGTEAEVGALATGEAALLTHPNFRGSGLLLRGDLDSLTGVGTLLGQEAAPGDGVRPGSALVGPATGLTLSPGEAQEGQERELDLSVPVLDLPGFDQGVRSAHSWRNLEASTAGVRFTYALAQEFNAGEGDEMVESTVYRTNIGVPPGTPGFELWADSEVDVEIAGVEHTLDPEEALVCTPNPIGQLTVTVEPEGLAAPTLWLRTPSMAAEERVVICPDRGLHGRLANLDDNELYDATDADGEFLVAREHSPETAAAVQHAVSQAMRMVVPADDTAEVHSMGIQPSGMEHRNWVLDLGEEPGFSAVDDAEATALIGTDLATGDLAQGWLKDLGKSAGKVTKVVVSKVKPITKPVTVVVGGAGKVVGDVAKGTGKVVGDVAKGTGDVVGGVAKGAGKVVGDVVEGTGDVVEGVGKGVGKVVVGTGEVVVGAGKVVVDATGKVIDTTGDVVGVIGDVGGDVVEGVVDVGGNVVEGVVDVGGKVIGGVVDVGGNVVEGVVDVGGKVFETVGDFLGDVGDWVVVTFKLDGDNKAIQFVVKTAKEVAKVAEKIYEQVGVAWNAVVDWLKEAFSFIDIGRLHEAIESRFLAPMFESGPAAIEAFRPNIGPIFDALEDQVTSLLGEPAAEGGGTGIKMDKPEMPGVIRRGIEAIREKIDWLVNKIFAGLENAFDWRLPELPNITELESMKKLIKIASESSILESLDQTVANIAGSISFDPSAPMAFLEAVKSSLSRVVTEGIALLRKAAEVIIDFLLEIWEAVKNAITDPESGRIEIPFLSSFYRTVTGTAAPTISRLVAFVVALPTAVFDTMTPINVVAGRGMGNTIMAEPGEESDNAPDAGQWVYGLLTIIQSVTMMVADSSIEAKKLGDDKGSTPTSQATGNAPPKRSTLKDRLAIVGQMVLIGLDSWREWLGTGIETKEGLAAEASLEKTAVGLGWTPIVLDGILLFREERQKRYIEEVGPAVDLMFDVMSTLTATTLIAAYGQDRFGDVAEGTALIVGHLARLPIDAGELKPAQVQNVIKADLALAAIGGGTMATSQIPG